MRFRRPTVKPIQIHKEALEAERALIGAVLWTPEAFWEAKEVLGDTPFITPSLNEIWDAIGDLASKGKAIDVVTLRPLLEEGALSILAGLAENVPTMSAVKDYAELVREWAIRKQLNFVFQEGLARLTDGNARVADIAVEAHQSLLNATHSSDGSQVAEASVIAQEIVLGKRAPVVSTPTQWRELDNLLSGGGFCDQDAIVIAGRPGMGKTSFAMQAAFRLACGRQKPSLFFSYEMGDEALVVRQLSGLAQVPIGRIRKRDFTETDRARLRDAAVELERNRIRICEANGMTAAALGARARTEAAIHNGLAAIVVDYIQLLPDVVADNRHQSVSANMKAMKRLAMEIKVPVLVLSQFNRTAVGRAESRPMMNDLKESGALEEDADVVIGLHRPGYYERESSGLCEVILLKQRNGPTGTANLHFSGETTSFDNLRPNSPGR